MKGSVYITLICVLVSGLSLQSCSHENTEKKSYTFSMSDTMMAKCEFYKVKNEQVKSELKLFGKITADNNKLAQVYPIVGGNVMKINVEIGDYVKQGQVLATVRSGEIAEFQKEKLDAQSDLALAEKNLQVAKDLFAGKLNSEKDVIAAGKEVEKANAELNRINEVYSIYRLQSGSVYNITAPMSGFIVYKDINQNEQLRADKADVLFSIADINEVWALANVNESDISKVKLGVDAEVSTLSFPDKIYKGKIDKIFNAIDPETRAMRVRVRIPNSDFMLKPEMTATINLHFQEHDSLPAIPSSSVIFDKSKNWVMVFHNRHNLETRRVEVSAQLGNFSYITRGLKPGEKVISKNGILIYDALND